MNKHTKDDLTMFKALPLEIKIRMTEERLKGWINYYGQEGAYISFSGGKDSTVLLDIIRNKLKYTKIPAVFIDVPTQYPELKQFAQKESNLEILKPKISFMQVCKKYGFPLISKEVSESVQGARKYLTKILQDENILTAQHSTAQHSTAQHSTAQPYYSYRRVAGIGEYSKLQNEKQKGWKQSETSHNVGNADKKSDDKGEYP